MTEPTGIPVQPATHLSGAIGTAGGPVPDWGLSQGQQLAAGLVFGLASVVALVYSVRAARQVRQPYPVYVMLSAGLIVFGEPFVDVLGHFKFPELDVVPYLHAIGRTVPLYFAPAYFFYFGGFWLVTMRKVAAGVTTRSWWGWYAGAAAFALAVEPIPIHLGWWVYYGPNQPLMFFGLPIWWGFANSASALVAGAILQLLISRRILTGVATLAIFPLLPAVFMGADTMMALPLYVALNSTDSALVANIAQLVTIALSLAAVCVCGRLLVGDAPPSEIEAKPPASVGSR
ncbi:MAG TPA: hypothetical protein VH008_06930 [Pseudonocardia sp.]|nr:hypothetical protein [Pseudonocardia sp.]